MSGPLTSKSWFVLWHCLRKSPTLGALRQRLDKLLVIYPSKSAASYIAFLWSIAATWAICCFNWELTLGYQATPLQEGIHSSMKSRLRGQRVPLHEVVLFFREIMLKRKFNKECNSNRVTLKRLYVEAESRGLKAFSEIVHIYVTEEGQQISLELLSSGFNFTVEKLENEKEVLECYESTKYRNTSEERFKLIIDDNYSNKSDVTFYKVMTRAADGPVDLVAVFTNGSFACIDPYFANHGLPSSQIMAVFIAGHVSLNVFFHFHPLYLQPFAKKVSHELAKDTSVSINQNRVVVCTELTVEAYWNYALMITESDWKVVGLGGQKYEIIINPTTNSIRDHSDGIGETCKKELQKLLPVIVYHERFRTMIFKVLEDNKKIQANEARDNAQARQKALGYRDTFTRNTSSSSSACSITVPVPPLVVGNNIFDRSKKRKTSGPVKPKSRKKKE